jgi:hypothetical protein
MQQREKDKKNICILGHNKQCDSNNLSVPKSYTILTYKTHVGPEMKVFQLCFQTTCFGIVLSKNPFGCNLSIPYTPDPGRQTVNSFCCDVRLIPRPVAELQPRC